MTTGGSASAATRNEFFGDGSRRSPTAATAATEASTITTAAAGQVFTFTTFGAVAELLKRTRSGLLSVAVQRV